jgi:hypothetical protein
VGAGKTNHNYNNELLARIEHIEEMQITILINYT